MEKRMPLIHGILICVAFFLLILDTRTAVSGVAEGIELCLRTVIPALFPFLILSPMLVASIPRLTILRPLGRLLGIPDGSESIVIAGLLCGYPVGAHMVHDAWIKGQLTRSDARRMAAFCNNAGPAFIFGIGGSIFSDRRIPWLLWLVQILSSFLVGVLLPGKSKQRYSNNHTTSPSLRSSLERSIVVMTYICGWVILFRIILSFFRRWLVWLFPKWVDILLCGVLELANGCTILNTIQDPSVKFLMMSAFLAFGGLSVHMQTSSVTPGLNITYIHLLGKLMQTATSLLLSSLLLPFIIPAASPTGPFAVMLISGVYIILSIFLIKRKNSSIPELCGV